MESMRVHITVNRDTSGPQQPIRGSGLRRRGLSSHCVQRTRERRCKMTQRSGCFSILLVLELGHENLWR